MIRHCSLLITPLADITLTAFIIFFALKILTKMKILFWILAVCSMLYPINMHACQFS